MELELGLKISQTRHDQTSTTKFQLFKDTRGPFFSTRETETMFILTAHLKGYRKENIGVKINEDGTQISVSGERPVQDTVFLGWTVQRHEVELRGFIKVFQIPSGVVLDRIRAKFREEESILTVSMPKSTKGIRGGVGIVEVKEEEVVDKGRPATKSTNVASSEDLPEEEHVEATTSTTPKKMVENNGEQGHFDATETETDKKAEEGMKDENGQQMDKESDKVEATSIADNEDLAKEEYVEATTIPEQIEEPEDEKNGGHDHFDAGRVDAIETATDKVPKREEEDEKKVTTQEHDFESTEEIDQKSEVAEKDENKQHMDKESEQIRKQASSEDAIMLQDIKDSNQATGFEEESEAADEDEDEDEDFQSQKAKETFQGDGDAPQQAETSQPDHPADRNGEDEAKENRIQEAGKGEDKHGKCRGTIENGSPLQAKADRRRRKKLCRPCVFAGSALFVSLVGAIVINWIRTTKRQGSVKF